MADDFDEMLQGLAKHKQFNQEQLEGLCATFEARGWDTAWINDAYNWADAELFPPFNKLGGDTNKDAALAVVRLIGMFSEVMNHYDGDLPDLLWEAMDAQVKIRHQEDVNAGKKGGSQSPWHVNPLQQAINKLPNLRWDEIFNKLDGYKSRNEIESITIVDDELYLVPVDKTNNPISITYSTLSNGRYSKR